MKPIKAYTELHLTIIDSDTDRANATLKIEWGQDPENSYELRIQEPAVFDNWVEHIKAYIWDCGQKLAKVRVHAHAQHIANSSTLRDVDANPYVLLFVDYHHMIATRAVNS